jgi:hypothetical protein
MSQAQLSYNSPDHPAFLGGRYLKAFDHLHDIDHYEHSILTYLGSLMPFDKGFINFPAFPSIATIARCTKISESTVRKKLRSLESKNYLRTQTRRFLNNQGKFEQSSNDYLFTSKAFDLYQDVQATKNQIKHIRKRTRLKLVPHTPPLSPIHPQPTPETTHPPREPSPNSYTENPKEDPQPIVSCSEDRDLAMLKDEVDRIIEAWESVVKAPVSPRQRETFLQHYVRIGGHEILYMERILKLISDPALFKRAQSINFLFSGFSFVDQSRVSE